MSYLRRLLTILRTIQSFTFPRDLRLVIGIASHRRSVSCPPELWRLVEPLRGFLRPREAGLLYWAAAQWPLPGPVIELGSFEGRSTVLFARAGRIVHAIDAWSLEVEDPSAYSEGHGSAETAFENFKTNLEHAQVKDLVRIHRGFTHQVVHDWKTPGALLYVDAGHTYDEVKNDLRLWIPFLLPGGLLIMHDVISQDFPGVKQAASELLTSGWRIIASADSAVALCRNRYSE